MFVLEWAYLGKEYIRCVVPIATSSRHSAWGISWGEAQRQSIYADPKYDDGYYSFDDPPATGLGAARMAALLTYRSRNSFESRFGRNIPDPSKVQTIREQARPSTPSEAHFRIHNDGHNIKRRSISRQGSESRSREASVSLADAPDPQFHGPQKTNGNGNGNNIGNGNGNGTGTGNDDDENEKRPSLTGGEKLPTSKYFSAQSYLRYQGTKFVKRFDSNCYIAMTRKLDTHDVSRGRAESIREALSLIEQPTLVLGIESDGLFTFAEQEEIAEHVNKAKLERIESTEGHDAFLLEFKEVNRYVLDFLKQVLPDIMEKPGSVPEEIGVGQLTKSSTFGEAEVGDITAW